MELESAELLAKEGGQGKGWGGVPLCGSGVSITTGLGNKRSAVDIVERIIGDQPV